MDKAKRRHVPHSQQPVFRVKHRNARERQRMKALNNEFAKLRRLLPYKKKTRVPKEDILKLAVTYIQKLRDMIHDYDNSVSRSRFAADSAASAAAVLANVVPHGSNAYCHNVDAGIINSRDCHHSDQVAVDGTSHPAPDEAVSFENDSGNKYLSSKCSSGVGVGGGCDIEFWQNRLSNLMSCMEQF